MCICQFWSYEGLFNKTFTAFDFSYSVVTKIIFIGHIDSLFYFILWWCCPFELWYLHMWIDEHCRMYKNLNRKEKPLFIPIFVLSVLWYFTCPHGLFQMYVSTQPRAVHPLPNAKDVYCPPYPLPYLCSSWSQSPGSSMIVAVFLFFSYRAVSTGKSSSANDYLPF